MWQSLYPCLVFLFGATAVVGLTLTLTTDETKECNTADSVDMTSSIACTIILYTYLLYIYCHWFGMPSLCTSQYIKEKMTWTVCECVFKFSSMNSLSLNRVSCECVTDSRFANNSHHKLRVPLISHLRICQNELRNQTRPLF